MSLNEEPGRKQPKIVEVKFESEELRKDFIRNTEKDQKYSEFIQEKFKQYALPESQKLEDLKIYHIDMDIEESNKLQRKNFVKSKSDVEIQRQNEKPQYQMNEEFKQIQTRTNSIIIKEIVNQSSQRDNIEIKIHQNIKEQGENEQQYITINISLSSPNKGVQQQSSEQHEIIEQSSQQSSIQLTQNENAERYNRYDEIRDNEGNIKMQLKRFELIIFENGVRKQQKKNENVEKDYQFSVNIENRKFGMEKPISSFIIYNQQIGINDRNILLKSDSFVTSSIINAYASYLQARDENYYFSLNKNERIKHKRLFIFKSDFLTNCNLNERTASFDKKVKYLIMEYFQDFKVIQYQFWLIYKKIAFIVNSNNIHWYLAVLDFQDGILKIYDSQPKQQSYYNQLNTLLSQQFSYLSKQEIKFTTVVCPTWVRQQDHYSCGYHTCIALEYLSQYTAQNQLLTLEEIKKILRKLLIVEEIQKNQQ
ncbi:unnamed protein product (macronuclear) [Paramecium tetraurelia]|uniref:Ubiquitin-like protease family profile domain-containing protein n=1 Tax=Paramecium tetraurelia TaxID=5888 RepID=A0C600_PARTE|nr:uncharacterized protein GSPATT00035346001 [Paramecium tetraurelia]CAK66217.1 unnamed protein product [Paramecium tetraurelia]|eukprot:XP_001433614.1 hypothetical protein (macronuclear) [Paramecium tetraurelia strain d4-2]